MKRFVVALGLGLLAGASIATPIQEVGAQVLPSPTPTLRPVVVPTRAPTVAATTSRTTTPRAGGFPIEVALPLLAGGGAALGGGALLLRRRKRD